MSWGKVPFYLRNFYDFALLGETPANGFVSTGKRFINQQNADSGSIMARHFTSNLVDCIKLCQWTKGKYGCSIDLINKRHFTDGNLIIFRCGSVNYGPINSQNVCELLSVETKRGSTALDAWVKDYPGWTYACCFRGWYAYTYRSCDSLLLLPMQILSHIV